MATNFYSENVVGLGIGIQISSFDSKTLFHFTVLNRSASNLDYFCSIKLYFGFHEVT